jgi:hypothetical protein
LSANGSAACCTKTATRVKITIGTAASRVPRPSMTATAQKTSAKTTSAKLASGPSPIGSANFGARSANFVILAHPCA